MSLNAGVGDAVFDVVAVLKSLSPAARLMYRLSSFSCHTHAPHNSRCYNITLTNKHLFHVYVQVLSKLYISHGLNFRGFCVWSR